MADQKISELTALTGANLADVDAFAVVDTSAVQTKKITYAELKTALDTGTGFVRITGDTMTGNLIVPQVEIGDGSAGGTSELLFSDNVSARGKIKYNHGSNPEVMTLETTGTVALTIDNAQNATFSGAISLNDGTDNFNIGVTTNKLTIKSTTSDGSDDTSILIDAGAAGESSSRGSYIEVHGNETASDAGKVIYQMGNVTGSMHEFRKAGGTTAATIDSSGVVNIGTASGTQPSYFHSFLNVQNNGSTSSNASVTITSGSGGFAGLHFGDSDNGRIGQIAYNNADNSLLFTSNNSTRMTLDASGNLGIGVSTSSGVQLNVGNNNNNSAVSRVTNGTVSVDLTASGSGLGFLEVGTNHPLVIATNATERMRIDSAGTLFLGTTSPTLHSSVTGIVLDNGSLLNETARGAGKAITLAQNLAIDSGNTWSYLSTDEGSYYQQFNGNHYFGTAPSGSAGADATVTSKLTISNGGAVGIGQGVFSGTQALNLKGEGIAIKNDKSGSNNNWSVIRNTGTSSTSNISFVSGLGEAMVIDHSGSVAIGSTNNGVGGSIDLSVGNTSSTGGITLWANTSGTHSLGFGDGYSGTDRYRGYVEYSHNGDSMRFATSATERMRINSSGNVGIGTTDPQKILHIKETGSTSATNEFIRLENHALGGTGAGSSINFHHYHAGGGPSGGAKAASIASVNTKNWAAGTPSNYSTGLTFSTLNENTFAERMRIDSSGRVGIGTTSPQRPLHVSMGGSNIAGNGFDSAIFQNNDAVAIRLVDAGDAGSNGGNAGLGNDNGNLNVACAGELTFATGLTANMALYQGSSTGGTERMRIDSSGNVGIGATTSLAHRLNIRSFSNSFIHLGHTGTSANAEVGRISSNTFDVNNPSYSLAEMNFVTSSANGSTGGIQFRTNSVNSTNTRAAVRMTLDSSGQLGIGVASGVYGGENARLVLDGTGLSQSIFSNINGTSASTHCSFGNGNGVVGTISTSGSATAYNTSSDYRLKENVDYTWNATTRLKQLKPARFNFIADDTNTLVDGFLAHEVSSVVPEAITGTKDAVDADGNPEYQGIDQSKLVPLLIKTILELEARITTLEG